MLQKLLTVPALGAVFLALTALLLVQNTELGISASKRPNLSSITISDPSSKELFMGSSQPQKLASAVSSIEARAKAEVKPVITQKPEPKVEVAAQTSFKSVAPGDIEGIIRKYAAEYKVSAEVMISIARCESGFRAEALSASGAYGGMYQFVTSTWQSNRRAMGLPDDPALRFNAEEAVRTAAFKMSRDGYGAWPMCSKKAIASVSVN